MAAVEVEFHPDAHQEYLDALAWYITHSEALGRRFQQALKEAINYITEEPQRCAVFEDDIRWKRLHRFPYVVYFEHSSDDRVKVMAVAHGRRRPGYWYGRRDR